jgi:hypothetical protein
VHLKKARHVHKRKTNLLVREAITIRVQLKKIFASEPQGLGAKTNCLAANRQSRSNSDSVAIRGVEGRREG